MSTIEITLVYSPESRVVHEVVLHLPQGSRVRDAWVASAWFATPADGQPEFPNASIWGRRATPDQVLHHGDRLEALRPLQVDPKEARRQRFVQQGTRGAGLFANRRPGAKPGY